MCFEGMRRRGARVETRRNGGKALPGTSSHKYIPANTTTHVSCISCFVDTRWTPVSHAVDPMLKLYAAECTRRNPQRVGTIVTSTRTLCNLQAGIHRQSRPDVSRRCFGDTSAGARLNRGSSTPVCCGCAVAFCRTVR